MRLLWPGDVPGVRTGHRFGSANLFLRMRRFAVTAAQCDSVFGGVLQRDEAGECDVLFSICRLVSRRSGSSPVFSAASLSGLVCWRLRRCSGHYGISASSFSRQEPPICFIINHHHYEFAKQQEKIASRLK